MPRLLNHLAVAPRSNRKLLSQLFLACPRIDPQWELAAIRAMLKPQMRGAIEHRSGRQRWTSKHAASVAEACDIVSSRLGFWPAVHLPPAGEYHVIIPFAASELPQARALAVLVSRSVPELWWVIERLFVRDGRFYRRRRHMLELRQARDVHLRRDIRLAISRKD